MRTLALSILVAVTLLGCSSNESPPAALDGEDAARILEQTPWLDRLPEQERDVVNVWLFMHGEGAYVVGNAYKGSYETFRYFVEDGELRVRFHDDGKTHVVSFRIERVRQGVFDYRMTLDRAPRGPKVYYGFDPDKALPDAAARVIDRIR